MSDDETTVTLYSTHVYSVGDALFVSRLEPRWRRVWRWIRVRMFRRKDDRIAYVTRVSVNTITLDRIP